jgi:peptide/nickel transport system substrate-binding protein
MHSKKVMKMLRNLAFKRAGALAIATALTCALPAVAKDNLVVDLPDDAATLYPHLQRDTDSYTIYRNIFDNLVTRDASGKIVPQVASSWR